MAIFQLSKPAPKKPVKPAPAAKADESQLRGLAANLLNKKPIPAPAAPSSTAVDTSPLGKLDTVTGRQSMGAPPSNDWQQQERDYNQEKSAEKGKGGKPGSGQYKATPGDKFINPAIAARAASKLLDTDRVKGLRPAFAPPGRGPITSTTDDDANPELLNPAPPDPNAPDNTGPSQEQLQNWALENDQDLSLIHI